MMRILPWTLVAIVVAAPRYARADDTLTTVNVSASGPDRPFPIRNSFYIAGKATKDVSEVHPVFVRYGFPPWGIMTSPPTCSQIKTALGALQGGPSFPNVTGVVDIAGLWAGPPAGAPDAVRKEYDRLVKHHQAYAPSFWAREKADADKDVDFKILIPKSTFFQDGARYCAFIYRRRAVTVDTTALMKAIDVYAKAYVKCEGKPNEAACTQLAADALKDAVLKATENVPNKDNGVRKYIDKLKQDALNRRGHARDLRTAVDAVAGLRKARRLQEWRSLNAKTYPFEAMLVSVLAHARLINAYPDGGPNAFYSPDNQVQIKWAEYLGDRLFVSTVEDPTKLDDKGKHDNTRDVPFSADQIPFPDSTLTLADVLQFAARKIRVDKDYVAISDLKNPDNLFKFAFSGSDVPDDPTRKLMQDVKSRLAALDAAFARAKAATANCAVFSAVEDSAYCELGRWIATLEGPEYNASPPGGANELVRLGGVIEELLKDVKDYDVDRAAVVLVQDVTDVTGPIVDVALGVSRDVWFFSYVTLTTGFAAITGASSTFWLNYLGLQVFFWPNPVDQPMWTNGAADVRRLFAFEVGMATQNGPFGPDSRYAGFSAANVPPLFIGGALQLLPYVTLSVGGAILSHKKSTLPQEHSDTFGSFYIGLSVQANVPDIVAAIKGRSVTVNPPQ